MIRTIQTEDGRSIGLLIEDIRYVNNEGFRSFGMKLLFGLFFIHIVLIFLALYVANLQSKTLMSEGTLKSIFVIVPIVSLVMGFVELIFISILVWEFKTSNHLDMVFAKMYKLPKGFEKEDFDHVISQIDPVETSFPIKQCMYFIEQNNVFASVRDEYEAMEKAFVGGKMTYMEYKLGIARMALSLGYKGVI